MNRPRYLVKPAMGTLGHRVVARTRSLIATSPLRQGEGVLGVDPLDLLVEERSR